MDSTINKNLEEIIENNNDAVLSVEGNNMYVVQWALILIKDIKFSNMQLKIFYKTCLEDYKNDIHKLTDLIHLQKQ